MGLLNRSICAMATCILKDAKDQLPRAANGVLSVEDVSCEMRTNCFVPHPFNLAHRAFALY